jgi:hypothetical protein
MITTILHCIRRGWALTLPLSLVAASTPAEARQQANEDPLAGTYTVGPTGDFASPAEALAALSELGVSGAVTFTVAAGVYNGPLVLGEITGATAADTVRFAANGEVEIVSAQSPTLLLNGASYVRFEGFAFRLDVASGAGRVLELSGTLQDVSFRGNRFTRSPGGDRVVSGENLSGALLFSRNAFEGGTSVFLSGLSNNRPELVFEGNTVEHLLHLQFVQSPVIEGNRLRGGVLGHSWAGTPLAPGLFANNVVRSANQSFNLTDASGTYIYHNTLYTEPCASASDTGGSVAFIGVTGVRLVNNAIVCAGRGTTFHTRTVTGIAASDYNAFHSGGARMASIWVTNPVHTFRSLAELRAHEVWGGRDAHSVSGYISFDEDLRTDAPWLARAGTPLEEVTTDIEGNPRDPAAPSIGAYEFTSTTTLLPGGTYAVGPGEAYTSLAEAADEIARRGAAGAVTLTLSGTQVSAATVRGAYGIGPEALLTLTSADPTHPATLRATGPQAAVLRLDARHVRLTDVTFDTRDRPEAGFHTLALGEGADDVEIRGVTFRSTTAPSGLPSTVYFEGVSHRGVRIIESRFEGGAYVLDGADGSDLLRAEEFVFARNEVDGAYRGLLLRNAAAPRVEGNRMHVFNRPVHCLNCYAGGDGEAGLLANNAFRVEAAPALDLLGNHQQVYHNTVRVAQCGTGRGVIDLNTPVNPSGFDLRNNVVVCETAGRVLTYVQGHTFHSDHNHYWSDGPPLFATNVQQWDTLEDFQQATGHELNSVFGEVPFVSAADLRLLEVGDEDFRGTVETLPVVAVDLLGEARPDPPRKGAYEAAGSPVGAEPEGPGAEPLAFGLEIPFPNPSVHRATVRFALAEPERVTLMVWDVLGREVVRAIDAPLAAGRHEVVLDTGVLASGAYLLRLSAGTSRATRRLIVLR